MMEHPSLFDPVAAIEARDEALDRVERNAAKAWKEAASKVIAELAAVRYEFTTDDVWDVLDRRGVEETHEPRALGALMNAARKMGLIDPTDRVVNSERVACHRRPVRVWRSRILPS